MRTLTCTQKPAMGGLGAWFPRKIWCCEMPKTSLFSLLIFAYSWHGNRIHFMSARMSTSVHLQFQAPGTAWRSDARKPVRICLVYSIPSNAVQELTTTFKICSFSDFHSSFLRPDHDVRADMDLYRRYIGFSPVRKGSAMLSQSKHWSGGRRVCQTCSAAPVILPGYHTSRSVS